jgi:hypothetical protein
VSKDLNVNLHVLGLKRKTKKELPPQLKKRRMPKGLWYKSPTGKKIIDTEELEKKFVSPGRWIPCENWKQGIF